MIIAPLSRARLPIVKDRVFCVSTPGRTIDVLVTQKGVAVNPARKELAERLKDAGIKVADIHDLKAEAEKLCGVPAALEKGEREVAEVIYRDGNKIDSIYQVK